jgi:hypothetical protein
MEMMARDDVLRMARECGWKHHPEDEHCWVAGIFDAEKFAALVAQAEREACAKIVDDNADACRTQPLLMILKSNAAAIRARAGDQP